MVNVKEVRMEIVREYDVAEIPTWIVVGDVNKMLEQLGNGYGTITFHHESYGKDGSRLRVVREWRD